MKLKRFVAPDTRTAMQEIKATLGPDAVILSSHKVDKGVEVVAAVDFDATILAPKDAIELAEPQSKSRGPATAQSPTSLDEMRQELLTLRGMLETQMRGGVGSLDPLKAVLLQKLLNLGVSQSTALSLLRSVQPQWNQNQAWQQILNDLSVAIPIRDQRRIEEGGVYAFVGPTGVGKTTTLAKIAARFALRFGAQNLGLVTMDTYRIAAQEQLVLYGKILGVQVCVAQDGLSLERVLKQLNDKKLILIDTAGMNPADHRVEEQLQALHEHLQSISTVLVLPATSQFQVLREAIKRYQPSQIEECIITKLDESMAIGGVLSALIESGLPVSYLTHGQRVPEDIKLATRHQLIDLFASQDQLDGEVRRDSYVETKTFSE